MFKFYFNHIGNNSGGFESDLVYQRQTYEYLTEQKEKFKDKAKSNMELFKILDEIIGSKYVGDGHYEFTINEKAK